MYQRQTSPIRRTQASEHHRTGSDPRPVTPRLRRPASAISLSNAAPTKFSRPETPRTPRLGRSPDRSAHSAHSAFSGPPPSLSAPTPYAGRINVSVRVKPSSEPSGPRDSAPWTIDATGGSISVPDVGVFTYDHVLAADASNADVYRAVAHDVLLGCLAGYHGVIFAYGMTGSGKTHSMQGTPEDPGLIPRCAAGLFAEMARQEAEGSPWKYEVFVSYLEIYNEKLHDLLLPNAAGPGGSAGEELRLRDDPLTGVRVVGLSEEPITSEEQLLKLVKSGDQLRRTSATDFNARSSRSHAVVQLRVRAVNSASGHVRHALLNLCDLAGSERATGQQERRKEGSFINKSLLALGTVVAKLSGQAAAAAVPPGSPGSVSSASSASGSVGAAGGFGSQHIPYRDSKLTRLLQPALSGTALVSILCTVDARGSLPAESINTLRFASRAKNVAVHAKRNELAADGAEARAMIERLTAECAAREREVAQLQSEVELLRRLAAGRVNSEEREKADFDASKNGTFEPRRPAEAEIVERVAQLDAENRILNERIEQLTRLQTEEAGMLAEISEDSVAKLKNAAAELPPTVAQPMLQELTTLEEILGKRQHEATEMKSYVFHLESQLSEAHKQLQLQQLGGSPEQGKPASGDPGNVQLEVRKLQAVIERQQEELKEKEETIKDKDRMIGLLKVGSTMRDRAVHGRSVGRGNQGAVNDVDEDPRSLAGSQDVPDLQESSTKLQVIPDELINVPDFRISKDKREIPKLKVREMDI